MASENVTEPTGIIDEESAQKMNSSPYESPVQHKESIASWFSIGALGASLTGKSAKDADKTTPTEPSGPSWGSSWLQSAKEKTLDTLESMKKDLNEFSDTIQQEACSIANVAATSVKSQAQFLHQHLSQQLSNPDEAANTDDTKATVTDAKAESTVGNPVESPSSSASAAVPESKPEGESFFAPSKWVRTFVESVQKLGIEDTTSDESQITEELRFADAPLSRKTNLDQCQLLQIQNDDNTYLQQPTQNLDLYREWLKDFRIMEYNGEINILLGYNPKLREIYSRLVPSEVDNFTFWNRYFFKVYLLELDKEIAQRTAKAKDTESSNGSGERDETWSLCSSANNDIQDLDDTIGAADGSVERQARDELKTPQLEDTANHKEDDVDGWEECDDAPLSAGTTPSKSASSPSKKGAGNKSRQSGKAMTKK